MLAVKTLLVLAVCVCWVHSKYHSYCGRCPVLGCSIPVSYNQCSSNPYIQQCCSEACRQHFGLTFSEENKKRSEECEPLIGVVWRRAPAKPVCYLDEATCLKLAYYDRWSSTDKTCCLSKYKRLQCLANLKPRTQATTTQVTTTTAPTTRPAVTDTTTTAPTTRQHLAQCPEKNCALFRWTGRCGIRKWRHCCPTMCGFKPVTTTTAPTTRPAVTDTTTTAPTTRQHLAQCPEKNCALFKWTGRCGIRKWRHCCTTTCGFKPVTTTTAPTIRRGTAVADSTTTAPTTRGGTAVAECTKKECVRMESLGACILPSWKKCCPTECGPKPFTTTTAPTTTRGTAGCPPLNSGSCGMLNSRECSEDFWKSCCPNECKSV